MNGTVIANAGHIRILFCGLSLVVACKVCKRCANEILFLPDSLFPGPVHISKETPQPIFIKFALHFVSDMRLQSAVSQAVSEKAPHNKS